MSRRITFEESLGASDWGLIIDKNGHLKGLFIPDGSSEDDGRTLKVVLQDMKS